MSKNSLFKDLSKSYKPEVKLIFKKIDLKEAKRSLGNLSNRIPGERKVQRNSTSVEFKQERKTKKSKVQQKALDKKRRLIEL